MALVLAQPEPNARSVLARKYRWRPSRSHAGEYASARGSVSASVSPEAALHAMTLRKLLAPVLEYASHLESGDHAKPMLPRSMLTPPTPTVPHAARLYVYHADMRPCRPRTRCARRQATTWAPTPSRSRRCRCGAACPARPARRSSARSPRRLWRCARQRPCQRTTRCSCRRRDQIGARSAAPELRVRLRASPFSTGMVNTSPLEAASTRWPVAESDTSSMSSLTSSQRVAAHGMSPLAEMVSVRVSPEARSTVYKRPSRSMTRASGPAPIVLTSEPVKRVTCRRSPEAGVKAQTLLTQSRSLRK